MSDFLQVMGTLALFAGFVLTAQDLATGCNVAILGAFCVVAGAPFWWREEGATVDE